MPSTFNCPACGQTIAADAPPGTQVQCPLCNQIVAVPAAQGPAAGDLQPPPVSPVPPQGPGPMPPGMPGPMPGPYGATAAAQVSSGMAIAALVCGIIGLVGCPVVGLVGLILGIVALVRVNREPSRYGGKGLAIGGVCTGGFSLLMVPVLIAIMLPALSRVRELSKREVCAANMRGIGQALYIYAQDDLQTFPELGADWQARLINAGYASPRQFLCPSDARTFGSSYYYVPGYGTSSEPDQIILYEDPAVHGSEGGNILFQDSHVEFVASPEYEEMISSITLPDGTPWAPHEAMVETGE